MSDQYWIIQFEQRSEIKVKGSRFIGESIFAADSNNAMQALARIRKREHAATHHCWAYRCGLEQREESRYSDDGEPSGTAGKPIADALLGHGVTDCLVVVTRYFGGTELGTGGLARAYADCAKTVLQASGKKECFILSRVRVVIDVSLYDIVARLAAKCGARQLTANFSEKVSAEYELRRSVTQSFMASVFESTSGRSEVEEIASGDNHA